LSGDYNPLKRPTGKAGIVDVNAANQVTAGLMAMEEGEDFVGTLHQQVMELGGSSDWSVEMLVAGWTGGSTTRTFRQVKRRCFSEKRFWA